MVSELRTHDAANVVELFVQTFVVLQTTPILDSELVAWLHDPLRPCGHDSNQCRFIHWALGASAEGPETWKGPDKRDRFYGYKFQSPSPKRACRSSAPRAQNEIKSALLVITGLIRPRL
ncbi:hypothetical protein TNCV_3124621 [Trichonephila clavipes]|nr:hypothetical protein TNCV_3124621 [Trichonephila clavipes]